MPFPTRKATGVNVIASTDPMVYLFAGDSEVVTDRAMVKANTNLAQFTVIALDGNGEIVAYTPDVAGGTLTFGGQPTAADTVSINGVAITFVAAGAVGAQVNIGADATATAQALRAYINAHPDTLGVTAAGAGTTLTLAAIADGLEGNTITLAKSGTYPAVSAATLTGGEIKDSGKAIGVLAEAVNTTVTQVATSAGYYKAGQFNHEVLVWPASVDTLAKRRAAVAGTQIGVAYLP